MVDKVVDVMIVAEAAVVLVVAARAVEASVGREAATAVVVEVTAATTEASEVAEEEATRDAAIEVVVAAVASVREAPTGPQWLPASPCRST